MKKFRGKRRYFRNLKKEENLDAYNLDFGSDGWFDFWHTHLDFFGYGNNSVKIRKAHIKAYLSLYCKLEEKLEEWGKTYQLWIGISNEDAGADAIYIHSVNPNEDNFPFKISNLSRCDKLPVYLRDVINLNEYKVDYYENEYKVDYYESEDDSDPEDDSEIIFVIQSLKDGNPLYTLNSESVL
jgi:hypothetical protein